MSVHLEMTDKCNIMFNTYLVWGCRRHADTGLVKLNGLRRGIPCWRGCFCLCGGPRRVLPPSGH